MASLDFKHWREQYEWPPKSGRPLSEERIFCIERLVKENISVRGHLRPKQVLLHIVEWKTRKDSNYVRFLSSLSDKVVEDTIEALQKHLHTTPDDVCHGIRMLNNLGEMPETLVTATITSAWTGTCTLSTHDHFAHTPISRRIKMPKQQE
jgi:hypothetical protein